VGLLFELWPLFWLKSYYIMLAKTILSSIVRSPYLYFNSSKNGDLPVVRIFISILLRTNGDCIIIPTSLERQEGSTYGSFFRPLWF